MSANESYPPKPAAPEDKDAAASETQRSGLEGLIERLRTLVGLRSSGSLRTDLTEVLEESKTAEGEFSPTERAMLRNILTLRERRIGDVMVPRADIIAVQKDIALGDLLKLFANAGHSRLVVHDDTLDDPVGMVHIRDLVTYMTERASIDPAKNARRKKPLPADLDLKHVDLALPLSATRIVRRILFAPPSMPVVDLLVRMQATRIHLALVIDEYGGTDGLVSIEDIVEEIVGNIEDEHDAEATHIQTQGDGSYLADARASLGEAAVKIGPAFAPTEENGEIDTLGGLMVTLAGRVPVRGEILKGPENFEIEVLDADPRRVKRLRIYRRAAEPRREARRKRAEDEANVVASPPISESAGAPASKRDEPPA
ncbi:MAG TPA: hemolysin family protein [Xanthobacteraceae bacterium]|jgi:CBS domain containing-hemolysin-like protein